MHGAHLFCDVARRARERLVAEGRADDHPDVIENVLVRAVFESQRDGGLDAAELSERARAGVDRGEAGAREPRHHGRNRRRRAAAARAALGVDLGLDAVVEVDKCPEADDLERKLALLLEPDAGRAEEGARDAVP
ncbi:MAG TPA: hypothetical protein RMH26_20545, partial [Polyangiaceae bacterium LLY-WYZ-15_(1-7)]|nr:hypothetical protein [Polyangiaceae bacterium LLY-WYZ-15_(1-7)]